MYVDVDAESWLVKLPFCYSAGGRRLLTLRM